MTTFYPPQAGSPYTTLPSGCTELATTLTVNDGGVLPAAPNLLTLYNETRFETVLMTAKSGNTLTVQRAVEGTARAWDAETKIARLLTAKDIYDLQHMTAADVGADGLGIAASAVNTHNSSQYSHSDLFAGKANVSHTHGNADLTELAAWAKASTKPTYTYTEVGAAASSHSHTGVYEPAGAVSTHNSANDAHASLFSGKMPNVAVSAGDNGKVLTVVGGSWTAATPSGGLSATTYSATIPSASWTQSGDYYTKTVSVAGLKATYPVAPVVDCSLSGTDADGDNAILAAFGGISIIDTGANSITCKAVAAPDVNIPITISVWE